MVIGILIAYSYLEINYKHRLKLNANGRQSDDKYVLEKGVPELLVLRINLRLVGLIAPLPYQQCAQRSISLLSFGIGVVNAREIKEVNSTYAIALYKPDIIS
jgi:hypothetical protein